MAPMLLESATYVSRDQYIKEVMSTYNSDTFEVLKTRPNFNSNDGSIKMRKHILRILKMFRWFLKKSLGN